MCGQMPVKRATSPVRAPARSLLLLSGTFSIAEFAPRMALRQAQGPPSKVERRRCAGRRSQPPAGKEDER